MWTEYVATTEMDDTVITLGHFPFDHITLELKKGDGDDAQYVDVIFLPDEAIELATYLLLLAKQAKEAGTSAGQ